MALIFKNLLPGEHVYVIKCEQIWITKYWEIYKDS